MLTNETISKLQDMRMGVMARQFKEQLDDPQCPIRFNGLPVSDERCGQFG